MSAPAQTLMILAGEASGDLHAACLVRALHRARPELRFIGMGGPLMRAEGVETRYDIADLAVMGITEVLKRYGFFRQVFHTLRDEAAHVRPAAVILVDYPGFNLRFAAEARKLGIRVIYYICPQVWAWNRARIPRMARVLDRLITIFPFEPALFADTPLRVDFAGHPLVDEAAHAWAEPAPALPWTGESRVALLPGSREHEIKRLLPDLLAAARVLESACPETSFLIAAPDETARTRIESVLSTLPADASRPGIVVGQTRQVLRQAHAAFVASGTATLEASLMLCPMIIVYRVSALTYGLARRLIRIPYIGLVNIVADRLVCPEFIQQAVAPEALAKAMLPLLRDESLRAAMQTELKRVNARLGAGGAADRAAACVLDELSQPS